MPFAGLDDGHVRRTRVNDKHLQRYLSEFDWRWNTWKWQDGQRAVETIKMPPGKRLTYQQMPK